MGAEGNGGIGGVGVLAEESGYRWMKGVKEVGERCRL